MKLHISIFCALIGAVALANGTATYRDSNGRNQGSAWTHGSSTTYRDGQGRLRGTARTDSSGTQTTYRDASGRLKGTKK